MNQKEEIEKLVKEIAWAAWKSAANAYRMYPDNKHTFSDYWSDLGEDESKKTIAGYAAATPSAPESYKSFLPVLEENYEACKKGAEKYHDSELDKIQYQAIVREYEELISIYKSFYSAPSPSIEAGLRSKEEILDIAQTIILSIDHYREAGKDDRFSADSIAEYLQRQFQPTSKEEDKS